MQQGRDGDFPQQALARLSGATRGEGNRQQDLLTLRGKRTPAPGMCEDNVQEPGEDVKNGTGKGGKQEVRAGV